MFFSKPNSKIDRKRVVIFSFGSGLCSSMYSFTIRSGAKLDILIGHLLDHVPMLLDNRFQIPAIEFEKIMKNRELSYNKGIINALLTIFFFNFRKHFLL